MATTMFRPWMLLRMRQLSTSATTTSGKNMAASRATSTDKEVASTDKKAGGKLHALMQLSKDIIPGNTILKKGIFSSALAALSTYLVQSGLYIPGESTLTLTSFVLLTRILYLKAGKPLSDYLDAEIAKEERQWYSARSAEKAKYAEQLTHLESFRDYPTVVQTVYDMQAANMVLEDAVARAKHRSQFHAELSHKAQEMVRKEQQRLAEEARAKREKLFMDLEGLLGDASVQKRIVEKFINDMKTQPVVTLPSLLNNARA